MEETLKTIRFVQRFVLAVSFATFAFALSIEKPNTLYQDALNEYVKLRVALPIINEKLVNAYQDHYSEAREVVMSQLSKIGIKNAEIKFMEDRSIDSTFTVPEIGAGISVIRDYLTLLTNEVTVFELDSIKFKNFIAQSLQDFDANSEELYDVKFYFHSEGVIEETNSTDVTIYRSDAAIQLYIAPMQGKDGESTLVRTMELYNSDKYELSISHILNELEVQELLILNDNGRKVLPNLHRVWQNIEGKTKESIEALLVNSVGIEKKTSASTLEIVGVKVNASIAYLVAPSILILSLVFLLVHIKHLSLLANDISMLSSFPWVGLYDDFLSKCILIGAILIVPIASILSLIVASDYGWGVKIFGAIISSGLVLVVGFKIVVECSRLRLKHSMLENQSKDK